MPSSDFLVREVPRFGRPLFRLGPLSVAEDAWMRAVGRAVLG